MDVITLYLVVTAETGLISRHKVADFDGPAWNLELCEAAGPAVAASAVEQIRAVLGIETSIEPLCLPARPRGIRRRTPGN